MRNIQPGVISGLVGRVYTPTALIIWGLVTVVAGISGPFGTYAQFGWPLRLFYWGAIAGVSILLGRTIRVIVEERFRAGPVWPMELVSISVMVPILTAVVWHLSPVLLGIEAHRMPPVPQLLFFVFFVAAIVAGIRQARLHLQFAEEPEAEAKAEAACPPRLWDRLPEELRCEIVRLTGQDHHVIVVTQCGETMIRMRFGDAIAEMEPVEGYCAHRSHWVTRAAISSVEREPGKIFLKLVNGDRVPVSRKYRPGLEEAGIL